MKFAVFTDLHHDDIFDGEERLREFFAAVKKENVSFIVSLGDLCRPIEQNRCIASLLKEAGIPVHFTAGNHDLAYNTPERLMDFLGITSLYRSFCCENIKFIILNACYMKVGEEIRPYHQKDHKRETDRYPLIPDFEVRWLEEEMRREDVYYIVFSHHSLINDYGNRGVSNRAEIREILSRRKTILCMNGHDHGADCRNIQGTFYYTLNSMSYLWHRRTELRPYPEELYRKYAHLDHMILYQNPLYCVVEIADGKVKITGAKSDYQHITPEEAGIPDRKWDGVSVQPHALDLSFSLSRACP